MISTFSQTTSDDLNFFPYHQCSNVDIVEFMDSYMLDRGGGGARLGLSTSGGARMRLLASGGVRWGCWRVVMQDGVVGERWSRRPPP